MWDVSQYEQFASERSRPFWDLVGQIPFQTLRNATSVVDLGCGTGELTASLLLRCRHAHILGIDSSPEMLKKAEAVDQRNRELRDAPGMVEFRLADIAGWSPEQPVDVIVSNASLQWLPEHEQLIPRLASYLSPNGALAVQMPNRFRAPSQRAIEETIADGTWRDRLLKIGLHQNSVLPTEAYARLLMQLGFVVNAWETTYLHVLHGENASLEWLKGTALRPLLAELDPDEQSEFQRALADRLNAVYPPQEGITIFPMQRLFFVATRADSN
jgi:trans-aconitate 2-methyltransferase